MQQPTHENIWQEAEKWIAAGLSIIPVKAENKRPAIAQWKTFQSRIIDKEYLWEEIGKSSNPALAVVCGRVSGNLELIDVDTKHFSEGGRLILDSIKNILPDLFPILRVHMTQSKGYHILYKIEGGAPEGNQKLAAAQGKKEAWLETRGEGGYALIPPSQGYSVLNDVSIPIISLGDRDALIALCRSFDTRTKPVGNEKRQVKKNSEYELTPWDDFAQSGAAEDLLLNHGWSRAYENAANIYFTRPGKDKGVSASFHKQMRLYYIFTSSTGFESSKAYTPSSVLCELEHGGDFGATMKRLVGEGYGRFTPQQEKRIIKTAIATKTPLPANITEAGKHIFELDKNKFANKYPHGIFWDGDIFQGINIVRHSFQVVAEQLGFRGYDGGLVDISESPFVKKVDQRYFFDRIKKYVNEEDDTVATHVYSALEAFFQRAGAFSAGRIELLDESQILKSTKAISYKFFLNGAVKITSENVELIPYTNIEKMVWEDEVAQREYRPEAGLDGIFADFLRKALVIGDDAMPILGFLCHHYKDSTMAYIIPMVENVEDPKMGGGFGKNVLSNMIAQATSVKEVAGEQVQLNEKFFQPWNGERVYALSDLPEKFNWGFLKNLSSNSGTVKKLYKDERSIGEEELPKFLLSTNYSYAGNDGALKRRVIPLEFAPYFKLRGGVDEVYNKHFPKDFDSHDWATFDNYIIYSIQKFLQVRKLKPAELTDTGWAKQYKLTYSKHIYDFISGFVRDGFFSSDDYRIAYNDFCQEEGTADRYKVTKPRMNDAMQDYCDHHGIEFDRRATSRVNGIVVRGLRFGAKASEPEKDTGLWGEELYF